MDRNEKGAEIYREESLAPSRKLSDVSDKKEGEGMILERKARKEKRVLPDDHSLALPRKARWDWTGRWREGGAIIEMCLSLPSGCACVVGKARSLGLTGRNLIPLSSSMILLSLETTLRQQILSFSCFVEGVLLNPNISFGFHLNTFSCYFYDGR